MTQEQAHHSRALDSVVIPALTLTFLLRHAPFLASRLLFGPFLDNVHAYRPKFSEVSPLVLSGVVPYYLPDIGTGFPLFESPDSAFNLGMANTATSVLQLRRTSAKYRCCG